jgi:4-hydroxybutyrate CoA-transferase
MLRTFRDDNRISVSEIAAFVEGNESPINYIPPMELSADLKPLAGYLSTLIRSGDTIQTGNTELTGNLIKQGMLDGKEDLGVHTEVVSHGIVDLVKKGVINGKRKNINPGKVVCVSFYWYVNPEIFAYLNENPIFEMRDATYTNNLRVIASHDNMVSINGALSMDLMGQMTVETTFGRLLFNGPGGLPEFAIGAMLSKGGRSIIYFPSTASNGAVSRIVPFLEEGTAVTLPRTFIDYVVTEYGIASLAGKSLRERANELIAIAHPDFRNELKKAAQGIF